MKSPGWDGHWTLGVWLCIYRHTRAQSLSLSPLPLTLSLGQLDGLGGVPAWVASAGWAFGLDKLWISGKAKPQSSWDSPARYSQLCSHSCCGPEAMRLHLLQFSSAFLFASHSPPTCGSYHIKLLQDGHLARREERI